MQNRLLATSGAASEFRFNVVLLLTFLLGLPVSLSASVPMGEEPIKNPGQSDRGHLLLVDQQGTAIGRAPMVDTRVQMDVSGIIARVQVEQRFDNPGDEWVEGVYVFPLPDDAAVDHMRLQIGERVIEGQIKERREASRIYTAAKNSGKRASLTEQERPNIFTNSVANIGPGETVIVRIEYQQTVRYHAGEFSLRFPLVVAPRYIPGNSPGKGVELEEQLGLVSGTGWAIATDEVPDAARITPPVRPPGETLGNSVSISVHLDAGMPLESVISANHRVELQRPVPAIAELQLAETNVPADRDFVLRWRPQPGNAPRAAWFTQTIGDDHYGLLMVVPPAVSPGAGSVRRELIFVIDTSGSMGGPSIEQARTALAFAIEHLRVEDQFNIIQFNSGWEQLFPQAVSVSNRSRALALSYARGLEAGGGTNMAAALAAALSGAAPPDRLRQIVFMTDGAVGNEDALFRLIESRLAASRLFTVGIGSAPNGHFMRRAAGFGRGTFTYIGNVQETGEKMAALFESLENPLLRDVQLVWPKEIKDLEMWPQRVPDLYAGEPLVVALRYRGDVTTVTVTGERRDVSWRSHIGLEGGRDHPGVNVLWARRKIGTLMDARLRADNVEKLAGEITRVALDHHLVSRFTSLVAVDVTPSRPATEPLRKQPIATNLPAGWEYHKVFANLPQTATTAEMNFLLGGMGLIAGLILIATQGRRW